MAQELKPDPLFPSRQSYVFMVELGKWRIMLNGISLPEYYPNKKQADQELKIMLNNLNISGIS